MEATINKPGNVQDAQLSQRDRATECVRVLEVLATSKRLELGDNILRTL